MISQIEMTVNDTEVKYYVFRILGQSYIDNVNRGYFFI